MISAREFAEWLEVYKLEPWGDDWEQTAKIIATQIQIWTKKKIDWRRFMPNYSVLQQKTPEQIEAEMHHWAMRHNARIKREEKAARS